MLDQTTFDLTSRALKLNPELYTAWNLRRRTLLALFDTLSVEFRSPHCSWMYLELMSAGFVSALEERLARLLADINLTTSILRSLPKVYWIWNHRLWCLSNIPHGPAPANEVTPSLSPSSATADDAAGVLKGSRSSAAVASRPDTTWKREAWERELLLVDKMLSVDPRNCMSRVKLRPTARTRSRSRR